MTRIGDSLAGKRVLITLAGEFMEVANAHGVLHHIEEPAPVLVELRRLLRPGGAVYVIKTHELAVSVDERLKRIETGVDQIWTHVLDSTEGK